MIELSILIPAVFERRDFTMYDYLLKMIGDKPVEVLALFDNKHRTLGAKRNALMAMAQGRFITHLDDDDWFIEPFMGQVLHTIMSRHEADVIAYRQSATLNGEQAFEVETDIAYPLEEAHQVAGLWVNIRRKPWTWCCWRRELVKNVPFPDCTNAEDYKWLQLVWPLVKVQAKIDHVLHVYKYSDRHSVAKGRA
jgi:hypothetical protein